jgi:hypothetical protein
MIKMKFKVQGDYHRFYGCIIATVKGGVVTIFYKLCQGREHSMALRDRTLFELNHLMRLPYF